MTTQVTPEVPIPAKSEHGGRPRTYPYGRMLIGESIFIPNPRVNFRHWQLATGYRFMSRIIEENGVRGKRIWRIA